MSTSSHSGEIKHAISGRSRGIKQAILALEEVLLSGRLNLAEAETLICEGKVHHIIHLEPTAVSWQVDSSRKTSSKEKRLHVEVNVLANMLNKIYPFVGAGFACKTTRRAVISYGLFTV